ncbi:hypothetical protein ROT00_14715 [Agromyces mediolanus]|uniref:hypothetical protein n=1 Tax=Agromyces mediolanus TaxID=41986 RepID=UPI0038345CC5
MARHLEFVFGPLGEETRLPCACAREGNHLRPTSLDRVGALDPESLARAERLRARRRGHRRRFRYELAQEPRHAA